jgi:hypothetical protein
VGVMGLGIFFFSSLDGNGDDEESRFEQSLYRREWLG